MAVIEMSTTGQLRRLCASDGQTGNYSWPEVCNRTNENLADSPDVGFEEVEPRRPRKREQESRKLLEIRASSNSFRRRKFRPRDCPLGTQSHALRLAK